MDPRIIHLHPAAPPKPAEGEPCNGCGVCCTWAPCPAGVLLSRRRHGACVALRWRDAGPHYRCGLVQAPAEVLPWLPAWAAAALSRVARRWIAAGAGCDCDLVPQGGTSANAGKAEGAAG